jgi:hypothetical protein
MEFYTCFTATRLVDQIDKSGGLTDDYINEF